MKIMLAPMEGVVDSYLRDILTNIGGYDLCVTEFVRVVDHLLPKKVFKRFCVELDTEGKTTAGTPVIVQLLGSNPEAMAINAARAAELGTAGIDLNFGCPAMCVNKRNGGSYLLQEPQRLFDIISAVRAAVDETIPVSAKIRLGFNNTDLALDIARAVEDAGASYVTVHARTKADGYKAPVRWEWLAKINEVLTIPMIANGDINSVDDYRRCVEISGCEHIMIGRGAVARPDLARQIRDFQNGNSNPIMKWDEILVLLIKMSNDMTRDVKTRYIVSRTKQWLAMLKREYPEAIDCFTAIRRMKEYEDVQASLNERLDNLKSS
ncbi:MAG: tRNA-dihydrouridine synthase [Gammaproteobacteria bacterium]|nr:tRNA-dihydrouridine synthase [Gammaproteobacteria bacterium]